MGACTFGWGGDAPQSGGVRTGVCVHGGGGAAPSGGGSCGGEKGAPLHPACLPAPGLAGCTGGCAEGGGAPQHLGGQRGGVAPQGPVGAPLGLWGARGGVPGGRMGGCASLHPLCPIWGGVDRGPPTPAPPLRAACPVAGGRSARAPWRGGTPSSPSPRDTGDAGWPSSAPAGRAAAGPCRASPGAPSCPHPASWPCDASVTPPPQSPWTAASSSGSQVGLASGLGAWWGGLGAWCGGLGAW